MKTVVITGANRGIGLELTKQFAKDNIVYALCRNEFPAKELVDTVKVVKLDVTDETAIANFASIIDAENIAVDLLINNAGISSGDSDVQEDFASITKVFATNSVSPMVLSIHLLHALKRAKEPVMLAVSSRMGTHAMLNTYSAQWWPYSASKAALSFAVSAFAINEPSIKSISVHPGWVKTDMGGQGADIEPIDSAKAIKKLYDSINALDSGAMYNYDGTLMKW